MLGNPIAYNLICQLVEFGPKTPSALASSLRRSVHMVNRALAKLRLAEVVRFDRFGRTARYRIKYPQETRALLAALGDFEKATRKMK